MKLTILGGGVMGSAIANALLDCRIVEIEDLIISDPNSQKLKHLTEQGILVTNQNLNAIQNAEIVIIAIKPQSFLEALTPLKNQLKKDTLVISIAAGVKISKIQNLLNHQKIVRVMPNTPALISEGFSGWFADKAVEENQKYQIRTILSSFGTEIELQNEDQIDAITALSGSGPAYVFLFMQSLIEGGIKLGLSADSARKATFQTLLGSVKLASSSKENLETLIENVTSKGGTTASARAKFDELKFKETVAEAMHAGYKRAKELANG